MKTNVLKTILLGIFATVAINASAFEGGKEFLRMEEDRLMEEILKNDVKQLEVLAAFETEAMIYIYDAEGNLIHQTTMSKWNTSETRKLISKSDFLAEVDGNQYFLLECM